MDEITREELEKKIGGGSDFVLIDVREPSEFAAGSIGGAILIPLGELKTKIKNFNFPPEKEIIVYCRSGRRSAAAAGILGKLGFLNVKSLKGGILSYNL